MDTRSILTIFITLVFFSCNLSDEDVMHEIESEDKATAQELTAAENSVPDLSKPSTLMTPSIVRDVFAIPQDTPIEFDDSDGKCAYDFVIGNESYHLDLLFYFPGEMDDAAADKNYEQLTTKYINPEDVAQPLEGIADQAVWSIMGGGQLIARHENEILILNLSQIDLNTFENLGITNAAVQIELQDKAKAIVNHVIEKL